jgi:hypothetical protein
MDKEIVINTNNATSAMQLFIPISSVDANNVYFTEKRKNVILDGNFVKIIYSTDHFEMNGLHLLLQIYSWGTSLFSLDEQLRALKTALPDPLTTMSAKRTIRQDNHSYSHSLGVIALSDESEVRESSNSGAKDERKNSQAAVSSRSCEPPVKFIEHFDPNFAENASQTELLCDIERRIVTNYIEMKAPLKNAVYNLKHQMDSGCFRFARECSASQNNSKMNCVETPGLSFSTYALKISGIWETTTSVGITVKFVKL